MIEQDPEQFIRAYLSLPKDSPLEVFYEPSPAPPKGSWLGESSAGRWRASGHGANAATIKFRKHHAFPQEQIHMVTFEDQAGQWWDGVYHIAQDEDGYWHMLGSGAMHSSSVKHANRIYPWVQIMGANGEKWLWGGGWMTDKAADAHLIRFISRDGHVIEDTVQDGLVVFQSNHPVEGPIRAEVYTSAGVLLGVQTVFDYGEGA